jgi:hypothetical protein
MTKKSSMETNILQVTTISGKTQRNWREIRSEIKEKYTRP